MNAPHALVDDPEGTEAPQRLRTALRANAAFSGFSGILIAIYSDTMPELLGAGHSLLYLLLGVGLATYAVYLVFLARRSPLPRREAVGVVWGDGAWVAGSAMLVAIDVLSRPGTVLVTATAIVVAAFAIWQARNLPQRR